MYIDPTSVIFLLAVLDFSATYGYLYYYYTNNLELDNIFLQKCRAYNGNNYACYKTFITKATHDKTFFISNLLLHVSRDKDFFDNFF